MKKWRHERKGSKKNASEATLKKKKKKKLKCRGVDKRGTGRPVPQAFEPYAKEREGIQQGKKKNNEGGKFREGKKSDEK